MGGFCTPSYTQLPEATSIIEGTEIPEWVAAAGREIFNSAAGIAGSPYPDYTGERFASYGRMVNSQPMSELGWISCALALKTTSHT
jgi:hypothetical protein